MSRINTCSGGNQHVSDRIAHWVTWRIVAELMRRHKAKRDLRVYELHPGGGQGDTLALYERRDDGEQVALNDFRSWCRLGGVLCGRVTLLDDDGGYVQPWLDTDDPKPIVDEVERLLGLRHSEASLPLPDAAVLTFMLMADLLGLACQSRSSLQWRSACFDSSGIDGGGLRPAFLAFPHLVARLPNGKPGIVGQRFWTLVEGQGNFGGTSDSPRIVVDLAGRAWYGNPLERELGVAEAVRTGGSTLAVALSLSPHLCT